MKNLVYAGVAALALALGALAFYARSTPVSPSDGAAAENGPIRRSDSPSGLSPRVAGGELAQGSAGPPPVGAPMKTGAASPSAPAAITPGALGPAENPIPPGPRITFADLEPLIDRFEHTVDPAKREMAMRELVATAARADYRDQQKAHWRVEDIERKRTGTEIKIVQATAPDGGWPSQPAAPMTGTQLPQSPH